MNYSLKIYLGLSFLLVCCSCNDTIREGNHTNDVRFSLNTYDSVECEFVDRYSNDSLRVSYCKQFLSGFLIREGLFVDEKTPLSYHYFYDSIGNVKHVKEYKLMLKDSSILNNFIVFDINGDTLYSESNFYKVRLLEDTIFTDETINIEVKLIPFYSNSIAELVIEQVINPDSIWLTTLDVNNNFTTQLKINPLNKPGRYTIRGMVREVSGDSIYRDLQISHYFSVYKRR